MTHSTAMSGVHRLDDEQAEFLRTLGLAVPDLLTAEQLQALLRDAEAAVAAMDNGFVRSMSADMLSELRQMQGL